MIFFTDEVVKRVGPEVVAKRRKRFKNHMKREFFAQCVIEVCADKTQQQQIAICNRLSMFEIHHIIPLELDGQNEMNNLALVEHYLHTSLHKIINAEKKLEIGEEAIFKIPRMEGKIWGDFSNTGARVYTRKKIKAKTYPIMKMPNEITNPQIRP
jgi:hypothetical protein